MKTKFYYITAILSMLMVALTGKAQEAKYEYVPMVREGVEWGYVYSHSFPPGVEYYRLQLKGDTVINGKTYKRCYAYQTVMLDTETAALHGFLREEDKRVYFIPNPEEEFTVGWLIMKDQYNSIYGDEERMIYDFNLNAGDTFSSMMPVTITEVTFVEVDGKQRKYFHDQYNGTYSFLEGIGVVGSYGELAYPFAAEPTNGSRVRFNFERNVADGKIVYKSEEFDDGDPTCSGVAATTMQAPAITITVAGKTVTASASGNGIIAATIHDINGRTVATAQSANGSLTVDMAGFTPGIYIVTATTANDRKTQKIIL